MYCEALYKGREKASVVHRITTFSDTIAQFPPQLCFISDLFPFSLKNDSFAALIYRFPAKPLTFLRFSSVNFLFSLSFLFCRC